MRMISRNPLFAAIAVGAYLTKDAPAPEEQQGLEQLTAEFEALTSMVKESKEAMDKQFRDLTAQYAGVEAFEEVKKTAEKHTQDYAELVQKHQTLVAQLDMVKKELDAPAYRTGNDKKDADTEAAIEIQKQAFLHKGGDPDEFKPDMDNLVDMDVFKSVARKLVKSVGIEKQAQVVRRFNEAEKKAFEAASMDSAFFNPQMLGLEVDCNIECAQLIDLYGQDNVNRSNFMYPRVNDYGAIGQYDCDAKCDAEFGPEGNIQYLQGQTYDFRGVFCFQRKVLAEANYDLLGFMVRSAQRSHSINRNRALISGDGVNEPEGWLTADCFTKLQTPDASFNHQDFRRFLSSAPVEYGPVVVTLHQNMFAYLASAVDNNGRFIFGDGQMTFSPDDARERIRISNCLPDATADNTLGNAANPFVAGSFVAAAGNWDMAYRSVSKRALWMEQHEGGSTAWCVKYQFGAEDGGFVACCPAARTLVIG